MILDGSWGRIPAWQYAERYLTAGTRHYSPYSDYLDISDVYHPQRGVPAFRVPTFLVPAGRGDFLHNGVRSRLGELYRRGDGFLLPVHPETLSSPGLFGREDLLDCERGPVRLGRARRLAAALAAELAHIDTLSRVERPALTAPSRR